MQAARTRINSVWLTQHIAGETQTRWAHVETT